MTPKRHLQDDRCACYFARWYNECEGGPATDVDGCVIRNSSPSIISPDPGNRRFQDSNLQPSGYEPLALTISNAPTVAARPNTHNVSAAERISAQSLASSFLDLS